MKLYPLKFKPIYKDYVWGGMRIIEKFDRRQREGVYAESWEISDREEGVSIVENGELAGRSLNELIDEFRGELVGTEIPLDRFPLLVKLIDSNQKLSVQVHPHESNANLPGSEPKTEMWYILEATPDAEVMAGLKPGVGIDDLKKMLPAGDVENALRRVPVKSGDAVYVPGGRIHTIGAGCLILEVQQNSNTTYRLYDWGRRGADGRPRELHIDEALQVIRWNDTAETKSKPRLVETYGGNECWQVVESPCFIVERLFLRQPQKFKMDGSRFLVFFCAEGGAKIEWSEGALDLKPGTTVMIPAALSDYELTPCASTSSILRIIPLTQ